MNISRITGTIAFAGSLALATTGAVAQDTTKKPHVPLEKTIGAATPTGPIPSWPSSIRRAPRSKAASLS
ncbi:MAG: hypothetical protein E5Y58_32355 [Mesorhizobium sp.]|nr:MAG: hypothetical protein E5Y58_32355 [Mesorhizobium sp.]